MSDFASRLLHARATAGMTQRDLALIANISAVQLSRSEGGKSTPRPAVLMQLAEALGVSKEWQESGHDAATDDAHSITVTSTQQGPDSYEVTFIYYNCFHTKQKLKQALCNAKPIKWFIGIYFARS